MARLIIDMAYAAAKIPWWVGLLLALVSFLLLHGISNTELERPDQMVGTGSYIIKRTLLSFALVGSFVIPVICVVGGVMSFVNARK